MNCSVCGAVLEDGAEFCPICGASTAMGSVEPGKIIYAQSEAQHEEEGDDSVTQLIPENYAQAVGDDSVTQLIPENYGQVQGDDSVTQLIPENQLPQKPQFRQAPSQSQFAQANYGQAQQNGAAQKSSKTGIIVGVVVCAAVVAMLVLL